MLEHAWVLEHFLMSLVFPAQVCDCLYLVNTVEKIANALYDVFLVVI